MGNLPTSRTITLNPSDPFPSSLGNELQDMILGHKAPLYWKQVELRPINNSGSWGGALVAIGGVTRLAWNANAVSDTRFNVMLEEGDTLSGFRLFVAGNGASPNFSGSLIQASTFTGADVSMFTLTANAVGSTVWLQVNGIATANTPLAIQPSDPTVLTITTSANINVAAMAAVRVKRV